jgi:hypothetical protein
MSLNTALPMIFLEVVVLELVKEVNSPAEWAALTKNE